LRKLRGHYLARGSVPNRNALPPYRLHIFSSLMESATVERPVPGFPGIVSRIRATPADVIAIWAFGAVAVAAVVGFFVRATYPNYDSYYALLWGRELLHLHLPSFEVYRAPTEHPLAVMFGAVLSLLGDGADRMLVLLTLLSLVALAAGTYRLGRVCFTPFVGAIGAFLVLTRFDFPSLAVRGYIDIPYMAIVVWAGALEAKRPRRGTTVFLLLAAAGLLRPEAWGLAGLYFLWMGWRATWGERVRYAALAAIGPAVWTGMDLIVTGDPFFSLHSTKDLAEELRRQKSGTGVLSALPQFLRETVKTPVYFAGLAGFVIGLWRVPVRFVIPAVLFLAGSLAFVMSGLAGLSVIVRYLMVPSVMMCLFAAITLGGFTMVRRGSRLRRAWALGALTVTVLGLGYTAVNHPSLDRFNGELVFRGNTERSLRALLNRSEVREGLKCGPISVPTHKLIPDTRWILDAGKGEVVARSDPSPVAQRKAQYGVAVYPVGRRNVLRTGIAVSTDPLTQVPVRGFKRIAVERYFSAYLRCPPARA
jgi:hypothetical protein